METLHNTSKIVFHLEQVMNIFYSDNSVKTINQFCSRIESLSEQFLSEDDPDHNKAYSFKGDMTELLAEIFFAERASDPRLGLINYRPIPLSEDYGVDGIGKNANGDMVAVQVKFRSNPTEKIDYASMSKTFTAGTLKHNLDLRKENTVFLFTTTNINNITTSCDDVFGKILRVIDRNIIANEIDNNLSFWENAKERISLTLDLLYKE